MKYIKKYSQFYRYLWPFWKQEALILFLNLAGMGLSLIIPYLAKLIIDRAFANKDLKLFIILTVSSGVIFVLNGVFSSFSTYLSRYIRMRISFNLCRRLFGKLQKFSYEFFQDTTTGQHLFKINFDIDQASRSIADVLPQGISLIPKTLFILAIVIYMSPTMALFALALIPFLYIVPFLLTKRLKKIFEQWINNSQNIFSRLQEIFSHMHLIKAFGREKSEIRNYIRMLVENIRFSLQNTKLEIGGSFASSLVNRNILGLILFYGGYQVMTGKMTLGSLSAIAIYLSQLSALQGSLAYFFQQIAMGSVSFDRLQKVLDVKTESVNEEQLPKVVFIKSQIQFKDVSFSYKDGTAVLKNLNFSVPGGSALALAGPSGCGKTTIANLLLRLYKTTGGEILIDGYNINILEPQFFYEQVGVVLQEPYLWNDTVENNIKYGKLEATFQEIEEAARIACIDNFINLLPKKYSTVVGENACKISEGQKQRLAIARAVIKKPKILVLDEALSSVDAQIEAKIIHNIREALGKATIIIVSHRLSTIKSVDWVYFLEGRDKVDIAPHGELLNRNNKYRDYLAKQVSGEESNVDISITLSN